MTATDDRREAGVPLPVVPQRSLRRARWAARAPRVLLWGTVALLAAGGVRGMLAGSSRPAAIRSAAAAPVDLAAQGLAAEFARRYLSYDASDPSAQESSLATLAGGVPIPRAPARGRRVVLTTRVVQDQEAIAGGRLITVAALTRPDGLVHLSVPVRRDRAGRLWIAGPPALIGGPLVDGHAVTPMRRSVDDDELRRVAARAVTNYLAGEADNLQADLAPEARVSLPALSLRVTGPAEVTWAGPGGVLVAVQARDRRGASYPLAYELSVRRAERWYVTAIQAYPDQP